MKPRHALPALHPLVLPESDPPLPDAVRAAAGVAERAEQAYRDGDHSRARRLFLTAGRALLTASVPGLPDLSGARTACYANALLAAVAGEAPDAVAEIRRWVAQGDPVCAEAVTALVPGGPGPV